MKTEARAPIRTLVATKNAGKLSELAAIFAGTELTLGTYDEYAGVAEGETSYIRNAMLKARALAAQVREAGLRSAVLADDSGLEVEALDGRPGVVSARYGGAALSWEQRRERLLADLGDARDRDARFVCVMVLLLGQREPIVALGTSEGRIALQEHGANGFGYDPVFVHPASGRTFAELSEAEKNAVSHRARAGRALLAALRERG